MFRRVALRSTIAKAQTRACPACITVPDMKLQRIQSPGSLFQDQVMIWGIIFGWFWSMKIMCYGGTPTTGSQFDKTLFGNMN